MFLRIKILAGFAIYISCEILIALNTTEDDENNFKWKIGLKITYPLTYSFLMLLNRYTFCYFFTVPYNHKNHII